MGKKIFFNGGDNEGERRYETVFIHHGKAKLS